MGLTHHKIVGYALICAQALVTQINRTYSAQRAVSLVFDFIQS